MSPTRTARFGLLLVGLVGGFAIPVSHAETARKGHRAVQAPHAARTAPDVTATIAKSATARQAAKAKDDEIPPPFTLPVSSRARVRSCGETWRDRKIAGTTGDDDWRDFAMKCLAGKDPAVHAD